MTPGKGQLHNKGLDGRSDRAGVTGSFTGFGGKILGAAAIKQLFGGVRFVSISPSWDYRKTRATVI